MAHFHGLSDEPDQSAVSLPHFFLFLIFYFLLFISGCPEDATRTGMNCACSGGVPAWSSCLTVLNNQENKEIINHLCLNLKPHTGRRTSRSRFASSVREMLLGGELTKQHNREGTAPRLAPSNTAGWRHQQQKEKKRETDKLFFCSPSSGTIKCTRCCCRAIWDGNQTLRTSFSAAESGEANFSFYLGVCLLLGQLTAPLPFAVIPLGCLEMAGHSPSYDRNAQKPKELQHQFLWFHPNNTHALLRCWLHRWKQAPGCRLFPVSVPRSWDIPMGTMQWQAPRALQSPGTQRALGSPTGDTATLF